MNRHELYDRMRMGQSTREDVATIKALVETSIALVRETSAYLDTDWKVDQWWTDEPAVPLFLAAVNAVWMDGDQ